LGVGIGKGQAVCFYGGSRSMRETLNYGGFWKVTGQCISPAE